MRSNRCLRHEDYTVGWICALPLELSAATRMLDEEHYPLPQDATDPNNYTFGIIANHNVVLVCLPAGRTGTNAAAGVATALRSKFRSMRFVLLVGIGGGVPSSHTDIRLGDVVVSQPSLGRGGVVQYDFGKSTPSGFVRTGFLNAPPDILLNVVAKIQSTYFTGKGGVTSHPLESKHKPCISTEDVAHDLLFEASYQHTGEDTCDSCDAGRVVERPLRQSQRPTVHYGTIASGNEVIRDGVTRDQLSTELGGVLCFEMEAAGVMNILPCLVIRGVCGEWFPDFAQPLLVAFVLICQIRLRRLS